MIKLLLVIPSFQQESTWVRVLQLTSCPNKQKTYLYCKQLELHLLYLLNLKIPPEKACARNYAIKTPGGGIKVGETIVQAIKYLQ